mgnify:CR=1 FL=1
MKIFKRLIYIYKSFINHFNNDPINCELYRKNGCVYIDGPYCNYPSCELLKQYKNKL